MFTTLTNVPIRPPSPFDQGSMTASEQLDNKLTVQVPYLVTQHTAKIKKRKQCETARQHKNRIRSKQQD